MRILALEFSSEQRSVAVWDGNAVRGRAQELGGRSSPVFALIETALREASWEREQIECVAVGIGPGSYTGIRAAISVAQGWQLGRSVRLLGISSVEGIAAQARAQGISGRVHIVVDAQRNELHLATYEVTGTELRAEVPLRLVSLNDAQTQTAGGGLIVGPEASRWFPDARLVYPDAATLAALANQRHDFVDGAELEPVYLRATSFVKAPPPRKFT